MKLSAERLTVFLTTEGAESLRATQWIAPTLIGLVIRVRAVTIT